MIQNNYFHHAYIHTYFHQSVLLVLVLLMAALQQFFQFSLHLQILFFVILTLSIGMFHGMLDIVLFKDPAFKNPRFLLAYGLVAFALILLLTNVEMLALPILLLLSVWHFGECQRFDKPATSRLQKGLQRYLLGANSLAAPFFLQGKSLYDIVHNITNTTDTMHIAWLVWSVIALAWLPALVTLIGLFLVGQFDKQASFKPAILETIIVWLAFVLLPIWLAFALYFAAYHAFRHIRDVLHAATSRMDIGSQGHRFNIAWVALLTMVLIVFVLVQISSKMPTKIIASDINNWLRMLVILLTAVTLPHAILVHFWRKNLLLKLHKSLA
jgi:Brp/Blh family beta-carotene 15,15'-monooxygenase